MTREDEGRGIAAFALRHGKAIGLVALGLCAWGVVSLVTLPSGIYPDVAFPRVVVIAERGEESVENMMVGVTRPLEEAVSAVPGLVRVKTKTLRGASEMSLDFQPSTDMKEALSQTRARVAALLPSLLSGVQATVEQQTPSIFPVISFNVGLDAGAAKGSLKDGADLMRWAQVELKPRLARLPDVFRVSLQGTDVRVILVEADPRRLAAARLSLDDLTKAVRDANGVEAVGLLERDHLRFQVLAAHELKEIDQVAALPAATRGGKTVLLGDVATVRAGYEERTRIVTGNGKDSVVVSLFMRYGGKVTDLSDHVQETLAAMKSAVPAGVLFTPVHDQADLVRESLGAVKEAIAIGIVLAVLVLWIFLGSVRLSLLAGISIPISVLGTFAILSATGGSLNLMSMGGIAVAIGLIIDDAIVVVENVARKMKAGGDRVAAVVSGTREVFGAVVGSSLTTVVVFIPLVLLEGVVGQFFQAMAAALAVGILASLIVSLTVIPILGAGPFGPRPGTRMSRRFVEALASGYERGIRRVVARPKIAALVLLLLAAAGVFFAGTQRTGFLPAMDEGGFIIDYRLPVGSSLAETDADCRRIEAILAEVPEVRSFSRRTGAELGLFATEQNTGDFLVGLKPHHDRRRSAQAVIDDVRDRLAHEVPQLEIGFVQVMQDTINDLAGNPSPLEVKVFGADYKDIQGIVTAVSDRLEKVPGVVDVASGVSFGSPEITYRLDPAALSRAGLTVSSASDQLRMALLGEEATRLRRGEQLVPVLVRYPDAIRKDPTWLRDLPIADGEGRPIPASHVADIEERLALNELARENQQPVVSVTANISGRDLGGVAQDVRSLLARLPAARGVHTELAGQVESQERAFKNLMLVLALAVGLVFLLLVVQFRSYRLPLVIFLTLPFALIGALLALRLTDTELNISSMMGLLMLVGLVVKNGIILIEYTAQLRREGVATLSEALVIAARTRLRPIVMTSLTAVTALLPLALNIGTGAELQRPLAIAIIGGLSLEPLFTLLVVPVAHLLLGEPAHAKSLASAAEVPAA